MRFDKGLRAIDVLVLQAPIEWPLTILYEPDTMAKLNVIFRRQLQLRHVGSLLTRAAVRVDRVSMRDYN